MPESVNRSIRKTAFIPFTIARADREYPWGASDEMGEIATAWLVVDRMAGRAARLVYVAGCNGGFLRRYNRVVLSSLAETNSMATDLETAPAPAEDSDSLSAAGPADSVVLHGISWKMYRTLRNMPENYNIRMTYDRGELEIMSPSRAHEEIAELLGTLIDVWAIELDVPIRLLPDNDDPSFGARARFRAR